MSAQRKERDAAIAILHGQTRCVIELRREQLNNVKLESPIATAQNEYDDAVAPPKQRLAFLESLLLAQRDGVPLTDEDIQDEDDTFMFEGQDRGTRQLGTFIRSVPVVARRTYSVTCLQGVR